MHKVHDGERFFVAGKSGMGKTHLIKKIIERKIQLTPHKNVYHLDTKKRGDFTARDGTLIQGDKAPDAFKTYGNRMVWQPYTDNKNEYSEFFLNILNAGVPAIVNIDECINMRFGDDIPRGLSILTVQGRLPGIDIISGTQEVARSPRQLLSQAIYVISFNLTNEYDERKMLNALNIDQKHLALKKYEFYVRDVDNEDHAKKYGPNYKLFIQTIH